MLIEINPGRSPHVTRLQTYNRLLYARCMSSNPDRTSFCILCGTWHFRDDVTPITLHSNRCLACMIRTDRANPLRVPDSVREMYEEALAQKSISWPLDWKD